MHLKKLVVLLAGIGMTSSAFAVNLTNNISGVGPSNSKIFPVYCVQDANTSFPNDVVTLNLEHGQTANNINQYSNNQYYVGGTVRVGGCSHDNTYLGYLDFNCQANVACTLSSYQPPDGVHITIENVGIDSQGNVTGQLNYTPMMSYTWLANKKTPPTNQYWDYVGVNLAGLEFSKSIDPVVIPNLSKNDINTDYTDQKELKDFIKMGINTVRVPVRWGYLQWQGAGVGSVKNKYYHSYVKKVLRSLTGSKIYTIVDSHSYMRFSVFGKEYAGCIGDLDPGTPCPDGTIITDAAKHVDYWLKFYNLMKSDPNIDMDYIMLDLNNEPVDIPNDKVFTIQVELIKALRAAGFTGYIIVSGNEWDGLHSWTWRSWKSTDGTKTYKNSELFSRANFESAGITDLDKIIINVHQYFDTDFSGNSVYCRNDLSSTGEMNFNLQAFADWLKTNKLKAMVTEFGTGTDIATCKPALTEFFDYMKENSSKGRDYGFMGWQIWSAGHGWGDYHLRVTPDSYHSDVMKKYLTPLS